MGKRIIFDVGHPAQVHHFKNIYWALEKEGWNCLYVAKAKDVTVQLLDAYNLKYYLLSSNRKGLLRKIIGIPYDDYMFYKIVRDFRPDFILNRFSLHSGHISKLMRITNIAFSDTEHAKTIHWLSLPFIDIKLTGESYQTSLGKNHLKYKANTELFYLHPSKFHADSESLKQYGIDIRKQIVIFRFVSWDAHHDIGQKGIALSEKVNLVKEISKHATVVISSEGQLPTELKDYQIKIPVHRMHDLIACAALYIGEGGTMASEAACLGTPSIYVNTLDAGIFHELAANDLLYNFRSEKGVLELALKILQDPNSKERNMNSLRKYLSSKIDVSNFVTWFLQNYPKSVAILNSDPEYQLKFV